MSSATEDFDDSDLTAEEIAIVTANERAGLVSQLACHFCGMLFDVKKTRSLRAHIEEVHVMGDTGYMCGVCCEEFTSRKAVETHMSTFHRTPKPLGCGTCGETFRVRNLLLKHIDSHTPEEINGNKVGLCYCGECFEFFESVTSLQVHAMTHREQAMFVCGACGLQTPHRHVMVKHLECHVISSLLCATDEQDFKTDSQSSVQMDLSRVCVDLSGHAAEDVNGQIEEVSETDALTDGVVEEEGTSYKCGVCQASFENLNEALAHAQKHPDDERHLVEGTELKHDMEYGVLVVDNSAASVSTAECPSAQPILVTQTTEMTKMLPPESLIEEEYVQY